MKKIMKFLLVFMFIGLEVIKADYNEVGINSNYTTVYRGDVLDISLAYDDGSFVDGITEEVYMEKTKQYVPVWDENGNYVTEPIYFTFDNTVFEINDSSEFIYSGRYMLNDLDHYNDGTKTTYVFDVSLIKERKDDFSDVELYDIYDGIFDDIVVSNIKLSVRKNVEVDKTYFLKTSHGENVYSYLPITVIDSKNNSNTISNINYCGFVNSVLANCNTRCKITGIGSEFYIPFDPNKESDNVEISVVYGNGVEKTYSEEKDKTKCGFNSSNYIILVGFDDNKIDEYYNLIINNVKSDNIGILKYNYNNIDNDIKNMINLLDEVPINEYKNDDNYITSLYYVSNNSLEDVYHFEELTLEEIKSKFSYYNKNFSSSESSSGTHGNIGYRSKKSYKTKRKITLFSNEVLYILIGIIIIFIVGIIVIVTKNKKKNRLVYNSISEKKE